ncbi:EAL domain-containing protein [Xenophilus arseniciresistens]|uniref:EAL domain-containing protein n=1 Tax=Xenophilus arseniciresistens TaxID=1283306 RepID=A0AAE3N7A3_9BURK|nr:EAL domain-containing protein [Xenophilus arseniciresistens]MDA7415676.1 EAL domain-containing protein [Xenophilus arseniciresistens]
MPHRPLPGHFTVRAQTIVWADASAHALLEYEPGQLIGRPAQLLQGEGSPALAQLPRPHETEVDFERASLRTAGGPLRTLQLHGERMDAQQVLWTCWPAARATEALGDADTRVALSRAQIAQGLAAGEFRLDYQPKVDMARGRVIGVEALVRWAHPEHGWLPPRHFVPSIQDDTLIEELGEWALRQAGLQCAAWAPAWREPGRRMPISVNISPRHLVRDDFIGQLAQHLRCGDAGISVPLELELLEAPVLDDLDDAARVVRACRDLGVPVLLDDFGTGYAMLSYLRALPVSGIKLDRSYVGGMVDDPRDAAIVGGMLALARSLDCEVVAEGVTTPAHARALLALGCTQGQGFGIAAPMRPQALPAWVEAFEAQPPGWAQPHIGV